MHAHLPCLQFNANVCAAACLVLAADGWPEQVAGLEALEEGEGVFPAPFHGPASTITLWEPAEEAGQEDGEPFEALRVSATALRSLCVHACMLGRPQAGRQAGAL